VVGWWGGGDGTVVGGDYRYWEWGGRAQLKGEGLGGGGSSGLGVGNMRKRGGGKGFQKRGHNGLVKSGVRYTHEAFEPKDRPNKLDGNNPLEAASSFWWIDWLREGWRQLSFENLGKGTKVCGTTSRT